MINTAIVKLILLEEQEISMFFLNRNTPSLIIVIWTDQNLQVNRYDITAKHEISFKWPDAFSVN